MNAEELKARIAELESQNEIQRRRIGDLERESAAATAKTERTIVEMHIRDAVATERTLHPAAAHDVIKRALENGDWRLDSRGKLLRMSEGVPDVTDSGD